MKTTIQWCDFTFNMWRGCEKVSPGCAHCYAETLSKRNPAVLGTWGKNGTRAIAAESYWRLPFAWDRKAAKDGVRRRVFCASLADVFEDRPDLVEPRRRLMMLILDTPHLDWLLLTKRPENAARLMDWSVLGCFDADEWPPNIWLGTTVEDQQRADDRIPHLLAVPAAVRFLSVEPMLGPVDLPFFNGCRGCNHPGNLLPAWNEHGRCSACDGTRHEPSGIDWVIVGGESGPSARPCDVAWIRSVRDQCREAGVACFVKQLGEHPVCEAELWDGFGAANRWGDGPGLADAKGGDPAEWPSDLRVRQFPGDAGKE